MKKIFLLLAITAIFASCETTQNYQIGKNTNSSVVANEFEIYNHLDRKTINKKYKIVSEKNDKIVMKEKYPSDSVKIFEFSLMKESGSIKKEIETYIKLNYIAFKNNFEVFEKTDEQLLAATYDWGRPTYVMLFEKNGVLIEINYTKLEGKATPNEISDLVYLAKKLVIN